MTKGLVVPCLWFNHKQSRQRSIVQWLTSQDAAAKERPFKAMLQMTKLDTEALEAVFN